MTITTVGRLFAGCLLALGIHVVWNALGYGYMRDATPGPGFFPFWVGLAMAGLSLVNLARSAVRSESLAGTFDIIGLRKTLTIVAVVAAFILVTPLVGMIVASGPLVAGVALAIRPRWTVRFAAVVLAIAVAFPVCAYFLFAVYLRVPVPRGVFGL